MLKRIPVEAGTSMSRVRAIRKTTFLDTFLQDFFNIDFETTFLRFWLEFGVCFESRFCSFWHQILQAISDIDFGGDFDRKGTKKFEN